jgi:ABC-type lipoprotein release transport system permease subunit
VALIAKSGAPPSVLVGVRNALDRGRGRTSVPIATALIGSVMAVAVLVAMTIFGASLTHLVTTPRLYGQNWQLDLGNLTTPQRNKAVATLVRDPAVTRITWSYSGKFIEVGKVPVESVFEHVVKGPMVFSLADGHYPAGNSQIALGSSTLSQAGLHLGSSVLVSIVTKKGTKASRIFKVVGVVALPPTYSNGGMGTGAVLPIQAAVSAVCPAGPQHKRCAAKLENQISGWNVAVGVAPGATEKATVRGLEHRFAQDVDELTIPINLVNFGQAVDFPLLLGLTLALFGAATLAHVLFVSVARRRRQVALLKVLGFVRRQVLLAVCWQAVTIALIGVVAGVPIGLFAGRSVWKIFATHLGAVPEPVVPLGAISLVSGTIVVGGVALALVPAVVARRVRPSEALREA